MARVGIFGATGMVGTEIIKVLENLEFPLTKLHLYASSKSCGKIIETKFGKITVENVDTADYNELDIAFWAIGGSWPKENLEKAQKSNCVVIDNSSSFRYEKEVPLVIPEVNADKIGDSKLISNPNCTTAIAILPIYEIYKKYGIKKIIASTYQATSGAGILGMEELKEQTKNALENKPVTNEVFAHPIAFNVIPHIDKFQENNYTKEEMKFIWENKKIIGDDSLDISCTCVRIPTLRAHSESIVVETKKEVDIEELKEILSNTNGVELKDDTKNNIYPMPINAQEKYNIEVGRIRHNLVFGNNSVEFFVSGDQILKGAALNAVQIAQEVIKQKF